MKIVSEVKKYAGKKWVLFAVGILLGGTVLAGIVALIVGRAKAIVGAVGSSAEKVAAGVNPTK